MKLIREKNIDKRFAALRAINPVRSSSRIILTGFFIFKITCQAFETSIRMLLINRYGWDGQETELLSKVKTIC